MINSKYSSLRVVFLMISVTFFKLDSYIFYINFSMISFICGIILSLQFYSINFIQFIAYSDVSVDFFSDNTSLRMGMTLMKLIGYLPSILRMLSMRMSLALMLSLLTSSSSWDINRSTGSNTSSNLSMIMLLKQRC